MLKSPRGVELLDLEHINSLTRTKKVYIKAVGTNDDDNYGEPQSLLLQGSGQDFFRGVLWAIGREKFCQERHTRLRGTWKNFGDVSTRPLWLHACATSPLPGRLVLLSWSVPALLPVPSRVILRPRSARLSGAYKSTEEGSPTPPDFSTQEAYHDLALITASYY